MRTVPIPEEASELRTAWKLVIPVDLVLRGQGADPRLVRKRQPQLVTLAERAIAEGLKHIAPEAVLRRRRIHRILDDRVKLEGGLELHGRGVAGPLAGADSIVAVVATLGAGLEQEIARLRNRELLFQLALDGFGTAAIGELGNRVLVEIGERAAREGKSTTAPLYPGAGPWELSVGHSQIFSLVDAHSIGVRLTSSFMMKPRKSLSFLVGLGQNLSNGIGGCRECERSDRCRHRSGFD